jgi:hypothetical protein
MKTAFLILVSIIAISCSSNECERKVEQLRDRLNHLSYVNDSLSGDNMTMKIDIGRYEIIMERLMEVDSNLCEKVTGNIE